MPLYEYRCNKCNRLVTLFKRGFSESSETCPHCSGTELSRLFSSFSIRKADSAIYEDILSDSNLVRGLERDDPHALAEWSKRMGQGLDEDITPEYEEMMGRMETGEMPNGLMAGERSSEGLD